MLKTTPFKTSSLSLIILLLTACGTPTGPELDNGRPIDPTCVPSEPPSGVGLDPFYEKYCDIAGVHIVAATEVPDEALAVMAAIVAKMLDPLSDTEIGGLHAIDLQVGVIGKDQVTTDMPEYSDLDTAFPEVDWDARSRGLGATAVRPLTTSAEENLLCYPTDPYAGESILVHEFGHTIKDFAVAAADPGFAGRVAGAYDDAIEAGLWTNTYAAVNAEEYWAEGVQSYFNVNLAADPADGVHNEIDTRSELAEYDGALFNLVDEVFGGVTIDAPCP